LDGKIFFYYIRNEEILWQGSPEKLYEEEVIKYMVPLCNILLFSLVFIYACFNSASNIIFCSGFGLVFAFIIWYIIKIYLSALKEKILSPTQFFLTTNYIIEKNVDIPRWDFSAAPSEFLEVKEDFLIIDLKGLQKIEIKREGKLYTIYFYLNASKKGIAWMQFFYLKDFQEIKSNLAKLLPLVCKIKKKKKEVYLVNSINL